jgi:hypothetical protein
MSLSQPFSTKQFGFRKLGSDPRRGCKIFKPNGFAVQETEPKFVFEILDHFIIEVGRYSAPDGSKDQGLMKIAISIYFRDDSQHLSVRLTGGWCTASWGKVKSLQPGSLQTLSSRVNNSVEFKEILTR